MAGAPCRCAAAWRWERYAATAVVIPGNKSGQQDHQWASPAGAGAAVAGLGASVPAAAAGLHAASRGAAFVLCLPYKIPMLRGTSTLW